MSEYKLLSSGSEFFDDLLKEIKTAQKTIVIKAFLWRNDECGQLVADTLREAADRGVKVFISKDRIGAFYEYGEGNGQSFSMIIPIRTIISARTDYIRFTSNHVFSHGFTATGGVNPPQTLIERGL